MRGLASLVAGAGAIAGGVNRGLQLADDANMRNRTLAMQEERQGRDRKQWAREDAVQADLDAARAKAQAVMQGFQQQAVGAAGAPNQYLTAGGSDGSTPNGMGPAANDMTPAQPTTFRPSLQQTLKAQEAFTDELFARGRVDEGVNHWLQGETQRVKLRQTIAQPALVAVSAGGDATAPLKAFYDTIDDGYELIGAAPTKGLDGRVVYQINRVNRATGKEDNLTLDQQQLADVIQQSVADPKMAAEYALKLKLEAFKGDVEQKNIEARGDQERKTEGVKFSYSLADNADKAKHKLGEVAARGAEERKSIGARTAGEIRVKQTPGAAQAEPTEITLGEGQTRVRKGLDGTYKEVAAGNPKTATSKIDWTGLTAKHYGEPKMGMMGESRMPGPDTMALSISAQEIYEANKDRAGMTPEKAIELAAKQHKAVTPGKK